MEIGREWCWEPYLHSSGQFEGAAWPRHHFALNVTSVASNKNSAMSPYSIAHGGQNGAAYAIHGWALQKFFAVE